MTTVPRRPAYNSPLDDADELSEGIDLIRRFAHDIETRLHRARHQGERAATFIALGEASQGLHRALVALVDWSGNP